MSTYTGRCHCGDLEWTVKLAEDNHILCHCDACKIIGGGEYTMNQIGQKNDINFTKGTPKVYTYKGDSGNPVHCYYCSTCTAHPYHHQTVLGDQIVVRTSLLQGGKALKVGPEIFGKDRLAWQPEIGVKTFPAAPE